MQRKNIPGPMGALEDLKCAYHHLLIMKDQNNTSLDYSMVVQLLIDCIKDDIEMAIHKLEGVNRE